MRLLARDLHRDGRESAAPQPGVQGERPLLEAARDRFAYERFDPVAHGGQSSRRAGQKKPRRGKRSGAAGIVCVWRGRRPVSRGFTLSGPPRLRLRDVGRLGTLDALDDLELDRLPLAEGLESVLLDGSVVVKLRIVAKSSPRGCRAD
jgi:hypothetical protein